MRLTHTTGTRSVSWRVTARLVYACRYVTECHLARLALSIEQEFPGNRGRRKDGWWPLRVAAASHPGLPAPLDPPQRRAGAHDGVRPCQHPLVDVGVQPRETAGHDQMFHAAISAYQAADSERAGELREKVRANWSQAWSANYAVLQFLQGTGLTRF